MADITVRGAGIFGLSIAWACVQRGACVRVIDPQGPGAGSSGGVVGALAPHVPENWNPKKEFQRDSLLSAEAFWRDVQDAGGVSSGYARTGRLQPILDARGLELAQARSITARTLWQGQATWDIEEAPAGWGPVSPTGLVIRDTLSALLHPRRAIEALVAALATQGVAIDSEGPDAGKTVWATGVAGLEALSHENGRSAGAGVKGQAAVLAHTASGKPQLFVDGIHIIPHLDGTVAVGSTSERDYSDGRSTDALLDAVVEKARLAVPALADAPLLHTWAGVRPRSRSRAPMLGPWPGRPGHFIANGGFKIGFGMAPKIAEVMADLMLDGIDRVPEGFGVSASL